MMKILRTSLILISTAVVLCTWSCSEETDTNRVDPDQVQVDDSNNYRYIFKDRIQKEQEMKEKELENEFHREDSNEK